jgi:hypothetical protein
MPCETVKLFQGNTFMYNGMLFRCRVGHTTE